MGRLAVQSGAPASGTGPLAAPSGRGTSEASAGRLTIGDLAREFDVTLRALRFYEDRGMLRPERAGMTRLYSERDRARLDLILLGKRVGLTLSEIRQLLDLGDRPGGEARQAEAGLKMFQRQVGVLKTQREQIDAALQELEGVVADYAMRAKATPCRS